MVRLRIGAQKLVPTSGRVARIYVGDSDRWVSYAPHDWSNSCVCVTVHHSSLDMSKFTEGNWQRAFTAVKEQFELESLLPEQENALREFLEGRNVFVNFPTGYGKSFFSFATHCLHIYLLSRGESSRLSISARMSKSLLHLSKISRS